MPDQAPAHSTVTVRTALCIQSGSLHAATTRLSAAGADLAPGADGWRGVAELAQSAVVGHIESVVSATGVALESARQLTDAAIWTMSDVG